MGFQMASTKMRILRTKGLSRNGDGGGVIFRLVFFHITTFFFSANVYHIFFLNDRAPILLNLIFLPIIL